MPSEAISILGLSETAFRLTAFLLAFVLFSALEMVATFEAQASVAHAKMVDECGDARFGNLARTSAGDNCADLSCNGGRDACYRIGLGIAEPAIIAGLDRNSIGDCFA